MATHILTFGWSYGASGVSHQVSKTGTVSLEVEETIATGQTVFQINFAIDVSEIETLFIVSDKDITVKTNSSGSPDNTLALKANEPVAWHSTSLHTCPLTVDVTKIFVANASGATATLKVLVLSDATP